MSFPDSATAIKLGLIGFAIGSVGCLGYSLWEYFSAPKPKPPIDNEPLDSIYQELKEKYAKVKKKVLSDSNYPKKLSQEEIEKLTKEDRLDYYWGKKLNITTYGISEDYIPPKPNVQDSQIFDLKFYLWEIKKKTEQYNCTDEDIASIKKNFTGLRKTLKSLKDEGLWENVPSWIKLEVHIVFEEIERFIGV
jgi:hypothetical protein